MAQIREARLRTSEDITHVIARGTVEFLLDQHTGIVHVSARTSWKDEHGDAVEEESALAEAIYDAAHDLLDEWTEGPRCEAFLRAHGLLT